MPNVLIPKEFATKRSLIAVPKKDYEALLAYRRHRSITPIRPHRPAPSAAEHEEREVLAMIEEAEAEYRSGTTTTITSAKQLRSL